MATAPTKKPRGKVGVIGLGIIGTRVAANLRSAGHQVYVWSRTPRAAPNFLGSVVEVADLCDAIQLFVSDDGALAEVVQTIAAALRPRHVVLCHATVSPEAAREAARVVEGQGARYLDAPFTGSKSAAQNRQLVYYVGGSKPALEEVRPILEASSKAILHLGKVGDASLIKIATNMMTASIVQTLSEALALVRAAGIDPAKFAEALENNGSRSGTSDLKLPAMIAGNTEPNFSLKHMLKDVRFAQGLADKYELSVPVADTTAEVLGMGMHNGWADEDFSVVAQLYAPPATTAPEPTSEAPAPDSMSQTAPPPPEQPKTLDSPTEPTTAQEIEPPAVDDETKPLSDPPSRPDETGKAETTAENEDEPALTSTPAAEQKDESTATAAAPSEEPPAESLPDAAKPAASEKKQTFRFFRNLFKSDLPEVR